MIINKSGITIRMDIADIRISGRATQGVRLINLRNGDMIASVTQVPGAEEETSAKDENLETTNAESISAQNE